MLPWVPACKHHSPTEAWRALMRASYQCPSHPISSEASGCRGSLPPAAQTNRHIRCQRVLEVSLLQAGISQRGGGWSGQWSHWGPRAGGPRFLRHHVTATWEAGPSGGPGGMGASGTRLKPGGVCLVGAQRVNGQGDDLLGGDMQVQRVPHQPKEVPLRLQGQRQGQGQRMAGAGPLGGCIARPMETGQQVDGRGAQLLPLFAAAAAAAAVTQPNSRCPSASHTCALGAHGESMQRVGWRSWRQLTTLPRGMTRGSGSG